MDIKHLQSFAAVVKLGSFTKAAEKLYLSQPTISAHIRALEEQLHQQLLVRTTKQLEITPKGREVYDYALHILELHDRMIRACMETQQRIIHLGASTIPSAYILPQLLPEFGRQHPDTYFTIHQDNSQNILEGLIDGIFDIGLVGTKGDDKLTYIPFMQDRMVLITPITEHFLSLKAKPDLPLQQLLKEPIILREKGSGNKKHADQFLESIHISEEDLYITARINDQETIKKLVAGGLGVSIISEQAAKNYVNEKRLLQFELPNATRRELYLSYRKDHTLSVHIAEFVEYVLEWFAPSISPHE